MQLSSIELFCKRGLVLSLVVASACTREKGNESAKPTGSPAARDGSGRAGGRQREPAAVRVAPVTSQVLPRLVNVPVSLSGQSQIEVFSRVSGRLSSLGPREGQPVRTGEMLFKVDRTEPGETFLNTPVLSPISGYVGRWLVTLGAQVTPQTPVVQIVDDQVLKAEVSLPASDWALIDKNTQVTVSVNGQTRPAKISVVSRAADPATGRGAFEIAIDNRNRAWKAGLPGRATLALEPRKRTLIPAQALTITDQGAYVFLVEENAAKKTPVKFVVMSNDMVEVTEGLSEGQMLVVAGNNALSDKSPVRVLDDKSRMGGPREGGPRGQRP